MNRYLFAVALGAVLCLFGVARAAVYDNVYWIGGDGEWTGDVSATPEYATGHWSSDPNAASGLPSKFVLGRNDGIRVGQTIGPGGYDLDRLPCDNAGACTTTPAVTIAGGTQLGTDIYINTGATVTYNPNRQLLSGDDGLDRFGDWRIQPDANFPGTPTMNLSNGSVWQQITGAGGDADGMWTRWNGAELNLDGEGTTFRRTGDETQGFASGAMMLASYHGYENSIQTVSLTNGARFENEGALWFGVSGFYIGEENEAGIRVVMTINNGHMDLTGGDEYELDNDGLPMRADLAFIYDWKDDGDSTTDETFVINFTGPGDITVDGQSATPLDTPAAGAGRGGIRVATMLDTGLIETDPGDLGKHIGTYGTDGDTQRSYQDLWDMGILRANNKSGLTGDNFNTFFSVTNNPGDNDYKLTSLLAPPPPSGKSKGDYNNDGKVDAADYVVWRSTVGSETDLRADGDGSLIISQADYIHWRDNFGTTGLPVVGSGVGSAAAVPEPGTALLLIVGVASLWLFKRK